MRFIDSHFHLHHLEKRGLNIPAMMERLAAAGFIGGLDIGVDPDDIAIRKPLLDAYPFLHYSVGLYPSHAEDESVQSLLDGLEASINRYAPHALGEIGLDYHWGFSTPERQQELCIEQIGIANRYRLPVLIHNREADYDMVTLLKGHRPEYGLVMHCYSAEQELFDEFVSLGAYLSFAGNLTYKNSEHIRYAAEHVPLERILIETDSPYLAPIPKRGKVNTPEYIPYTYEFAAGLRNMEPEEFSEIICNNYSALIPNA